jgi:GT2 family glycosyltransferase
MNTKCSYTNKICYWDETDAWNGAMYRIENDGYDDLQVYRCPQCKCWHLRSASVQLHNEFWRARWSKRVWLWFRDQKAYADKFVDKLDSLI